MNDKIAGEKVHLASVRRRVRMCVSALLIRVDPHLTLTSQGLFCPADTVVEMFTRCVEAAIRWAPTQRFDHRCIKMSIWGERKKKTALLLSTPLLLSRPSPFSS